MTALICGSVAYDNIMVYHGHFKDHILPDKVHVLSVSFLVPDMRKEFGGCAGNIAYNLKLMGEDGLPMATVGKDFEPYATWMDERGINRRHVSVVDSEFTAQAFITTDLDDNQITAFHPGAMNFAHLNEVSDVEEATIAIVSPDGRDGMLKHARDLADAGIAFIFDPGQAMPLYDGADLTRFIEQATYVTVNDYEWELISERTGLSEEAVRERVSALIITRGGSGSTIHADGKAIEIPAARPVETLDPTGCGDAYRAGLLYGLLHGLDWEVTGRIASLLGAIKIASHGTQNHHFDLDDLRGLYTENFGRAAGF